MTYSHTTKRSLSYKPGKTTVEETKKNSFPPVIMSQVPSFNSLYTYEKKTLSHKNIQYYYKNIDTLELKDILLNLLDDALELFPVVKNTDNFSFINRFTASYAIRYLNGRQTHIFYKKTSLGTAYAIKLYQTSYHNIVNHIFCNEILKISKQRELLFWNELVPYPITPEVEIFGVAQWLGYAVTFCIVEWIDGASLETLQSKGVNIHMAQILKNLSTLEISADLFLKNWIMNEKGLYYIDVFVPHGILYKNAYEWDQKLIK